MNAKREYGIDLLRVLCMMGILGVHILIAGEGRGREFHGTATGCFLYALHYICLCSVNLFAAISGYLYAAKAKVRSRNLIGLLVNVEAYSVVFTIVLYVCSTNFLTDAKSILGSLFPMTTGAYWYLVCYIFVFLMIPWLNLLIRSMTRQQYTALLVVMYVLCCVVPTVGGRDYFVLEEGYSALWLLFCYLVGGYIQVNKAFLAERIRRFWYPVIFWAIVVLICIAYLLVSWGVLSEAVYFSFVGYNALLPIISAAAALLYFIGVNIESRKAQKLVRSLSDAAFDVYVIHCHHLFYDIFIRSHYDFLNTMPPWAAAASLLGIILAFYVLGWVSCLVRKILFRILKIDDLINWVGEKIDFYQEALWDSAKAKQ